MDLCRKWLTNTKKDPVTNKRIVYGKSTWQKWYNKCKDELGEETVNKALGINTKKTRVWKKKRETTEEEPYSYMENLPEELKLEIFSYLKPQAYGSLARASKSFQHISMDEKLRVAHWERTHPWIRFRQLYGYKLPGFENLKLSEIFELDSVQRGVIPWSSKLDQKPIKEIFNKLELALLYLYYYNYIFYDQPPVYALKLEDFSYKELFELAVVYIKFIIFSDYDRYLIDEKMWVEDFLKDVIEHTRRLENVKAYIENNSISFKQDLAKKFKEPEELYIFIRNALDHANIFTRNPLALFFNAILTQETYTILREKSIEKYATWYNIPLELGNLLLRVVEKQNEVFANLGYFKDIIYEKNRKGKEVEEEYDYESEDDEEEEVEEEYDYVSEEDEEEEVEEEYDYVSEEEYQEQSYFDFPINTYNPFYIKIKY